MNAIAALHKMATKEIMAVPVASCTHALPGHGYPRDAPKFVQQTSHTHYCLATLFLCPVDTLCLGVRDIMEKCCEHCKDMSRPGAIHPFRGAP